MTVAIPSVSLEQAVAQHGDTLYRIALLLTDQQGQAEQALRRTVQRAAREGTAGSDLPTLLRLLLGVLDQQRRQRRWPMLRPRARRFTTDGPLYRGPGVPSPFTSLPFEQRRILALHLLVGYDPPRLAYALGAGEEQMREDLAAALAALAVAGGTRLPSATNGEQCLPVRTLLMRDRSLVAIDPALRAHLALCSLCRAFDATWSALGQQAEAALRNGLRHQSMPRALASGLAAISRTAGRERSLLGELVGGGRASFVAVPLVVLLVIGGLVLPGFLSSQQRRPTGPTPAPAEVRALVQRALALTDSPPPGQGVWHAQWQTLWYFPNGSYAPR